MRSSLGNISEVRPGVWRVRVSRGRKADGSRRVLSSTVEGSRSDAEAEARRLALLAGSAPNWGSGMKLEEYVYSVFLPTRSNLKAKTLASYESDYRLRISERFGGLPLEAITRPMVQAWLSEQPAASAKHYMRTMSAILNGAVDDGCLDAPIPLSRMRYPRRPYEPTAPRVWSAADVSACFDALEGPLRPLWLVMVGAGLSRSEACALEWSDLAESGGMVFARVTKAFTEVDGLGAPKNPYRYRTVPVAPPFGPELFDMAGEGRLWPWMPDYASKTWRRLFDDGGALEGLPYVPLNRMRATHETLLQSVGVVDSLNARLHGRSNVQTGYRHYLEPGAEAMGAAAAELFSLFEK